MWSSISLVLDSSKVALQRGQVVARSRQFSYFCPVRASYSARPSSRQSFGIQDDNASRRPAFNSQSASSMAGRGCYNCGGFGHQAANCPKSQPTCYNCGAEGHLSKDCTQEAKPKACYKCGQEGHLSRDCTEAVAESSGHQNGQECYRCGQVGHIARACPNAATTSGGRGGNFSSFNNGNQKTCFSCGGVGHLQRDCVQGPKCYNCSEIGHMSKDCPQPQRRACYNCGSEGHISRDCPSAGNDATAAGA